MATSEDFYMATSGDFLMATDMSNPGSTFYSNNFVCLEMGDRNRIRQLEFAMKA